MSSETEAPVAEAQVTNFIRNIIDDDLARGANLPRFWCGHPAPYAEQLSAGVARGWISELEKAQLEELRTMTLDAISVDDFAPWELRSALGDREAAMHAENRSAA